MLSLASVVEEAHGLVRVGRRGVCLGNGCLWQVNVCVQKKVLGFDITIHNSSFVDELYLRNLENVIVRHMCDMVSGLFMVVCTIEPSDKILAVNDVTICTPSSMTKLRGNFSFSLRTCFRLGPRRSMINALYAPSLPNHRRLGMPTIRDEERQKQEEKKCQ